MDFDAGIAHRADDDRQRDALQQREVDMDVELMSAGLAPASIAASSLHY
jgi:hypothetical protein